MATDTLFIIPFWVDVVAVAIGSLQGALFASRFRDRRLDLLGIAIIGTATGLGGGLLRDFFLNVPPVAFQTNWYLLVAVGAALFGMLLNSVFTRLSLVIDVLDALTIGLFAAIGTSRALALGIPEIPAIFIGVAGGVGGGVIRDILLNVPISVMHVGSLYAVAAGSGSALLVLLVTLGTGTTIAAISCVTLTFLVRILAMKFGWSLPEQRALERMPWQLRRRAR